MPLLAVLLLCIAACAAAPASAAGSGWSWPVEGEVITPFRNGADPYAGGQHRGIDVAARMGTPVGAATAGTVRFVGVAGSSGLTVSIRTADGAHDTSYLHLARADVRAGQRVQAGQRVGAVGTSGRRSATQPHLHFGVRAAGSDHAYLDPLDFLPSPAPRTVPRGAPAPSPAPVRARPVGERGRRRAPARRRVRVPVRRPVRVRVPAGRPAPVPLGRRIPVPSPRGVPHVPPVPSGRRAPVPRLGPAGAPVALPEARPFEAPARREVPRPGAAGGVDLGLALACLGLLAAAACLAGPGESRRRERGRAAVRAGLRPLTRRRPLARGGPVSMRDGFPGP